MAVEVVLMIPILLLFMLLVVAGGSYVSVRADMEAAARDAARAASLERSSIAARSAATASVSSALDGFASCRMGDFASDFRPGGAVTVTIDCKVPNDGLGLIGLHGTLDMSATGSAPLDTYRRTE
jgi:Flp pilus assembly protein TadG